MSVKRKYFDFNLELFKVTESELKINKLFLPNLFLPLMGIYVTETRFSETLNTIKCFADCFGNQSNARNYCYSPKTNVCPCDLTTYLMFKILNCF